MPTKNIAGKDVEFDDEGFMVDYNAWDESIAAELAKEEEIPELTDRHFVVINFMRKTFEEKGTGPSMRALTKTGGVPTKELYALFPKGPAKKAARIAGIKKPQGCV